MNFAAFYIRKKKKKTCLSVKDFFSTSLSSSQNFPKNVSFNISNPCDNISRVTRPSDNPKSGTLFWQMNFLKCYVFARFHFLLCDVLLLPSNQISVFYPFVFHFPQTLSSTWICSFVQSHFLVHGYICSFPTRVSSLKLFKPFFSSCLYTPPSLFLSKATF